MKFEFSAGGIVYKSDSDGLKILLAKHSYHKGWVFPKGLIDRDKNETKEEAALREVKEESGADGEIQMALEPNTFWYKFNEEKRKKTVYYFIMKYIGGDISQHDFEMEDVRWYNPDEVIETLAHKGERDLFKKALSEIKKLSR